MMIFNPFFAYKSWRERRAQRQAGVDFARGFEFAASLLLIGRTPATVAEYITKRNGAFDNGIGKALGAWHQATWVAPRGTRRVVCAAVRYSNGKVLTGARHFGPMMREQHRAMGISAEERVLDQGFLDQWDVFMTRQEALEVAQAAQQILEKTHPADRLFSEDIY